MIEAGALLFGAVIGWVTYFTMRYSRRHAVSDIATIIGAIGGAAVLALFPAQSNLFGFYGVGLGIGFFVYVLILLITTLKSTGAKGLADAAEKKNPFLSG
jgi:hypothetical protein